LPPQSQWSAFQLACDFLETNGRAARVEMQLKSGLNAWIEASMLVSGPGWKSFSATLDQFQPPPFGPEPFDPRQVRTLVVNIRMMEGNVMYDGRVDNIRFIAPSRWRPADLTLGSFRSANSTAFRDSDGDGLPDSFETGTGIFVNETNTGTQAGVADSDGDGMTDWEEVRCRTNPNQAADVLALEVELDPFGAPSLIWNGRAGVQYTIEASEGSPGGAPGFCPVPGWIDLTPALDSTVSTTLPVPAQGVPVFYRLRVSRP
jgi:hypothetical protein